MISKDHGPIPKAKGSTFKKKNGEREILLFLILDCKTYRFPPIPNVASEGEVRELLITFFTLATPSSLIIPYRIYDFVYLEGLTQRIESGDVIKQGARITVITEE